LLNILAHWLHLSRQFGERGTNTMQPLGRRGFNQALLASGWAGTVAAAQAGETVLRVAMTVADIPLTTGQPSQGSEGIRFMGITAYDALVNWDLSRSDVAATLRPGLAESWAVDPAKTTQWTFWLRRNVVFHDGSAFDADSVVWNLDKLIRREAPQYDQGQATQAATWTGVIAGYHAADPFTVVIETKIPMPTCRMRCRASSWAARSGGKMSAGTGVSLPLTHPALAVDGHQGGATRAGRIRALRRLLGPSEGA
jgi:peptide/nickel transport system substrate-binding protein